MAVSPAVAAGCCAAILGVCCTGLFLLLSTCLFTCGRTIAQTAEARQLIRWTQHMDRTAMTPGYCWAGAQGTPSVILKSTTGLLGALTCAALQLLLDSSDDRLLLQ